MKLGEDIAELCMGCMNGERANGKCARCGFDESGYVPAPHHLPLRTILGGKYFVGKVLGEGGFGITYLGWDLNLDLKLAIKEYYPTGFVTRDCANTTTVTAYTGDSAEFYQNGRDKFVGEAKSLAKFYALPGIVAVKDFFLENGTAYIVMEFIDGLTLKEYLRQMGGKLPAAQVLEMMKPLLRSLAEVHKAGMIHRDISPDNIMITKEGNVKLLDFGAARDFSDGNKSLSVLLKPGYAPEEQYRTHGQQGPWTDIYALCATMYRAIAGETPPESLERLREDALEKPSALGVAISAEQESTLLKGLAVFQQDRWQDIAALSGALYGESSIPAPVAAHTEQPALDEPKMPEKVVSIPNAGETAEKKPSVPHSQSGISKRTWGIAGGACAAVLLIVLSVSLLQKPIDVPVAGAISSSDPASSLSDRSSSSVGSSPGSAVPEQKATALKEPENPDEVVVWQDAAMEAAIRKGLGKPTGDITAGDLSKIESLHIVSEKVAINTDDVPSIFGRGNVESIEELKYLINLSKLTLMSQKVSDLSPLSRLTSLSHLDLHSNKISDISPLDNLTSLTDLYIGDNEISDISPLADLTFLTDLHIGGNEISDISPLANLTYLTNLNASDNMISDISPLSGLTSLTNLYIRHNQIRNLSPLAELTSLTDLNISDNSIIQLSPLTRLNLLTDLNISQNQIIDLSPLADLTSLANLNIFDNNISDLIPLAKLSALNSLSSEENPITDWSPVAHVRTVQGRPDNWKKASPTTAPTANNKAVSEKPSPQPASSTSGENAEELYLEGSELYPDGNAADPLLKSANLGNINAQYLLAQCYDYGEGGVQEDDTQAFTWMLKAAQGGHDGAAYVVGQDYAWGYGTEKNAEQALYWLKKAAASKDYSTQFGANALLERHENGDW